MFRFLIVVAALALAGCGDPLRVRAQFENFTDTLSISAVTGTPATAPSALSTMRGQILSLDPSKDFDVVFDIDSQGRGVLYPVQLVGGVSGRTGIQHSDESFDAIDLAPTNGYVRDTATVVAPGDVVLIQAEPLFCSSSITPDIYSKLVVDAVDVAARTISFRIRVDPNCGFRSFAEGFPER
jgi:hypothetical protein